MGQTHLFTQPTTRIDVVVQTIRYDVIRNTIYLSRDYKHRRQILQYHLVMMCTLTYGPLVAVRCQPVVEFQQARLGYPHLVHPPMQVNVEPDSHKQR